MYTNVRVHIGHGVNLSRRNYRAYYFYSDIVINRVRPDVTMRVFWFTVKSEKVRLDVAMKVFQITVKLEKTFHWRLHVTNRLLSHDLLKRDDENI